MGLGVDIEDAFFEYLNTYKCANFNGEYASVEIKRSSEGDADLTEVEEYLVEKLAPLMKDEYSIGYYADCDSKSGFMEVLLLLIRMATDRRKGAC